MANKKNEYHPYWSHLLYDYTQASNKIILKKKIKYQIKVSE
jgi:hypothetical protein